MAEKCWAEKSSTFSSFVRLGLMSATVLSVIKLRSAGVSKAPSACVRAFSAQVAVGPIMAWRHVEIKSAGEKCGCHDEGWSPPSLDLAGSIVRLQRRRRSRKPLAYRPLADALAVRRLIGLETLSCKDEPLLVSRGRELVR